jgi:purine-binding chemotaxis protein CheW
MPTQYAEPTSSPAAERRADKYLIFRLSKEEFGIPVRKAREILSLQEITAVPNTPHHIRGVINLRGKIIPVVDLRLKFGMPADESPTTCIVVVQVERGTEILAIGMVVDSVIEVSNLRADDIDDAPDFGESVPTPWLMGIARAQNGVRILLHVDQVVSAGEMEGLSKITH